MEFIRPRNLSMGLDMAPLIDIVFQLLIFFMLSSSFLNPALKLNLPKAIAQDETPREKIIVSVDKKGSLFVNTAPVPMDRLQSELSAKLAKEETKAVFLRGDADMPYKLFVQVMDISRQAGAQQINIVHEGMAGREEKRASGKVTAADGDSL
ncbi:MAG: hypothetical protein A2036_01690 [Omnitrophica bacterium GWA2_50_21]|nr:MAG: hypothetical protein A2036_01690 [Omnitrophica bacterium GWA2_50_21]